jgi:hypothetical protein
MCGFTSGQSQYKVLYSFGSTNGIGDGVLPNEGMVFDQAGNLYGTTNQGGAVGGVSCYGGCGTIFELSPNQNGGWTESVLYEFCASTLNLETCPDGGGPSGGLIIDKQGNLYGTSDIQPASGTVFELSPPSISGGAWTQTVLWTTVSVSQAAPLTMDSKGNIYGTTAVPGGDYGSGSVYELSPPLVQGGTWTPTTLYSFCPDARQCPDGWNPASGVIFDHAGNLFGVAGGTGLLNSGVVFTLSQAQNGQWSQSVLYAFPDNEQYEPAGITLDPVGNVYGAFSGGGVNNRKYCGIGEGYIQCGGLFKLAKSSNWKYTGFAFRGPNGGVPLGIPNLNTSDKTLYGLTEKGGTQTSGVIFQVNSAGEADLYNFCSQTDCTDGEYPETGGGLTRLNKALFGTAAGGGTYGYGVVFEFTP